MFGLVLADPGKDTAMRKALVKRLDELMLPAYCFTEEQGSYFDGIGAGEAFIRRVCMALLMPDTPIPADRLLAELMTDAPRPANAIRKVLQLQLSLLPKLRLEHDVMSVLGGHMLGPDLLVPHVDANGAADCTLPDGEWTELRNGEIFQTRFRGMYSITEQPVLVRRNTLLPVGVNSRVVMYDDADRVTLHWYQPAEEARLTLAAGDHYHARRSQDGSYTCESDTSKPWRLIVHRDGEELLVH